MVFAVEAKIKLTTRSSFELSKSALLVSYEVAHCYHSGDEKYMVVACNIHRIGCQRKNHLNTVSYTVFSRPFSEEKPVD